MTTDDPFIRKHLDRIAALEVFYGKRELYISCKPGDEGAFNIPHTNEWIRKISHEPFTIKEITPTNNAKLI